MSLYSRLHWLLVTCTLAAPCLAAAQNNPAQATPGEVVCKPAAQRAGDIGCWVLTDQPVGPLTTNQAFWHLDTYPTREAATAARGPRGTVLAALGQVWLLTIEQASWKAPAGAQHVATIGPMPLGAAKDYSAQYMEAIFTPGMKSSVHLHPGAEAIYTTAGEGCMETSAGTSIGRAGGPPIIVPEGTPMQLVATGTETRRSVILILHDSSLPAVHHVHDWTPKGLCGR